MAKEKQEKICGICGGTGQVSFFQGVSRFLLSTEECEECAGTGFQQGIAGGSPGTMPGETGEEDLKKGKK